MAKKNTGRAYVNPYAQYKGLKHARCGSHWIDSGTEIPIGVIIHTDFTTGRNFYVSGIGNNYLIRYTDNGEFKSVVYGQYLKMINR